jgi:hypothetical protein
MLKDGRTDVHHDHLQSVKILFKLLTKKFVKDSFDVPAVLCELHLIIIITENLYMPCRHLAKKIRFFL